MEIKLKIQGKEMFLINAKHGFTLGQKKLVKDKKTGEKILKLEGDYFFGTLASTINRLFELKVGDSDAKTLTELYQVMQNVRNDIDSLFSV